MVLNETLNNDFATGNAGSQVFIANSTNTRFKLYPSDQKKILLDTLNTNSLIRQTPTGTLSSNISICSLQPSPIDPVNNILRDAKATPAGCGTTLSWSNVQWASPSVYYKAVGARIWQHLYQIPCQINGQVCSGSINTDEISPELIPLAGIEFKLLQFDDINSGQLSAAFRLTAHRFADSYEYDDGDITDFSDFGIGFPTNMVIDNRLSTGEVLGVAQHNHSFHSPAVYDSKQDIDSIQILSADFAAGKTLSVKVFNMAAGLNVNMQLKCAGIATSGIFEGQSGIFDFQNNPAGAIVTDPATGAKTMSFAVTKQTRQLGSDIDCLYNRVIITRTAGTPSENLTYSVVINDPANIDTPVLSSASSVCNNNYCILLLGSQFAADAAVTVRENINGSATIAQFSGNDIYSRALYNGQQRIQFPIQNLSLQDKFNNNGLCFKVLSNGKTSNEKCYIRPTTAPQGPFMGQTLTSYKLNIQDIEHTSYVVVGGTGNKLKIWGNSWKKIAYDYTVTANTVLEFGFRSNQQQAEINGIGFIMNGSSVISATKTWQVFGTQQNFGNQSFHNYSGSDWVTYRIPIGESFTGQISNMVFIADEDNHVGQNIAFKNPILIEDVKPPITGFSFDPIKNGHGVHISQTAAGTYLLYLYSYDQAGRPEWFFATSAFINNRLSGSLYKTTYNFSNSSTSQSTVGSFTIDYGDGAVNNNSQCNGVNRDLKLGSFSWTIGGQTGSWCLQPSFVTANTTPEIPALNSGVWYEPASAGWGISLQTRFASNNYSSFAVVYYYDANGNGRWASGFDALATVNSYNYAMLHTIGYPRTTSGTVSNQGIGTFNPGFASSNNASLNILYPLSPGGSWIRNNVAISRLTQ
ncbi:MAG: hypothetical protein JKY19_10095 [Alcanivoracaceae bacterium]|nr:hypothetical protein [Alcanivoracaceae bacterium]